MYAVAGDRGNLLALAKEHHIPIPFDCRDGECGSCLVEVKHLTKGVRYGIALTEKEKELLKQLGKITKEQLMDAEVNDMPPPFRLAASASCVTRTRSSRSRATRRCRSRDRRFPSLRRSTRAVSRFTPWMTSSPTPSRWKRMRPCTSSSWRRPWPTAATRMAALFERLGSYSRLHLEEAKAKCKRHDVTLTLPPSSAWPDGETPEKTTLWAGDPSRCRRLGALKVALQGERRGFEFYYAIAGTTTDGDIRSVAKVRARGDRARRRLKRWIEQEEAALRLKADASATA